MFHLNCMNGYFLYPRMSLLYLHTLFLNRERVHSTESVMFYTVIQSGQTKDLLSFYDNWSLHLLCLVYWQGGTNVKLHYCHLLLYLSFLFISSFLLPPSFKHSEYTLSISIWYVNIHTTAYRTWLTSEWLSKCKMTEVQVFKLWVIPSTCHLI